ALDMPNIYVYRDPIDFRKSFRGLAAIVELELNHNPFDGALYAFTNRQRNKIKCLYWEHNGFVLYYKSLAEEKFRWPRYGDDVISLTGQQINCKRPRIHVYPAQPLATTLTSNNPHPGVSHEPVITPHRTASPLAATYYPLATVRPNPGRLLRRPRPGLPPVHLLASQVRDQPGSSYATTPIELRGRATGR